VFDAWKICVSKDDACIASGTQNGDVNIWSIQDKELLCTIHSKRNKFILSSDFHQDGTKIASSSIDGVVSIYDIETKTVITTVHAHALPARSISFSGDLIYTASDDRHVSVIDSNSGTVINSFAHSGLALCVDASPDSRHFVVGCSNKKVYLWDLGMQRYLQMFNSQHSEQVWGVSFDHSDVTGSRFSSVGDDGVLQIFEKS
jgi:WD40 repeat protein